MPLVSQVYDVQWCPANPAVFASVDGLGGLSLYDLTARDSEVATWSGPHRSEEQARAVQPL